MVMNVDIPQIRSRWSDVLDLLEREDRIAWLVFFDARLARLEDRTLFLDFSDSRKFPGNLEYGQMRDNHRLALQQAIKAILGVDLEVVDA